MKTILHILKATGGWHHGLHLRIENPPYMALVIEATDESGPCGLPALSVCHYGEQNGDAMRDPEMCFELSNPLRLGLRLVPYYYRQDYLGLEQWSRYIRDDHYAFRPDLYAEHERFAALWDKNLYVQGFLAAFERERAGH
jgi:hypothetical protein